MTAADRFPSYRAPVTDREVLCVPRWPTIREKLVGAREGIAGSAVEIFGSPLAMLARDARDSLIAQAQTYTKSYAIDIETSSDPGPLILTGHQPELSHAGVWLKNFAAAQLARDVGGTAISLVIDNDLYRASSLRVPTGTAEQPQVVDILFDRPQPDIPYEQRTLVDRALWTSFGERVTRTLAPLVSEPLIRRWWPEVVGASERVPQLGLAIAQARHRLEQSWGCHSLEIPQSHLCDTPPFQRFALHLFANAARLRADYNDALAEYREVHRLRSAAQPLPNLTEAEGWIESPFWIWTRENPTRRALFVKPSSAGLQLSDRLDWQDSLQLSADGSADAALQQLTEWRLEGLKLRTRALITTLYARLLLADTFIHGIGGAKYDQVTDALCERFFGVVLPPFVTLTGTLRLPIDYAHVPPTQQGQLRQTLREMHFHPESLLSDLALDPAEQSQVDTLVQQKRFWVKTAKTPANAAERHEQIVAANAALQSWLLPRRRQLERELSNSIAQTRTNRILESREYPFCLFPHDLLRTFLLDFSRHIL